MHFLNIAFEFHCEFQFCQHHSNCKECANTNFKYTTLWHFFHLGDLGTDARIYLNGSSRNKIGEGSYGLN
jgi:hypothetical protein